MRNWVYPLWVFGLISFTLLGINRGWAALPKSWEESPYAYNGMGDDVETVLRNFANSNGVQLEISFPMRGKVEAKIRSESALAFIQRLALEFRFQWFVYGGVLYISPMKDQQVARVEVSEDAISDLKKALTEIGLLDPRFGWGELPDEGVVLVTGPKKYVEQVKKLSKKKLKDDEKNDIMIFPLTYASVSDRTIQYRNSQIVIPGVATVMAELLSRTSRQFNNPFQNMNSGIQNSNNNLLSNGALSGGMEGLTGIGDTSSILPSVMSNLANMRSGSPGYGSSSGLTAKVAADVRNNFLLIHDDREKKPMYEGIIKRLDVPRKLVEISAIILDIDRVQLAEFGAQWQLISDGTTTGFNPLGVDPFLASGTAATILINNPARFLADLRALEGAGDASIVATPTVLTVENQPAVIDLSETVYITATGERVANIRSVTAGISLNVVPRTIEKNGEQLIKLIVDIEDGRLARPAGSDLSVRKSTISTQAVMNNGRALVLGGFNVNQRNTSERKVPLVGEIPLVGSIFSYEKQDTSHRERLFILSPRIISLLEPAEPSNYVSETSRNTVMDAVGNVEKQRQLSIEPRLSDIESALRGLAKGMVPDRFYPDTLPSEYQSQLCKNAKNFDVNFSQGQFFQGKDFDIAIGLISNPADGITGRFNEADCDTEKVLAVAVWPSSFLKNGDSAEVFVVVAKDSSDTKRDKLIIK